MMTASRNSSSKLLAISFAVLILTISNVQVSAARIAQPLRQANYAGKLEAYLQAQMKTYKIPGMAVAIVRDGEVQYMNGLGTANTNGDAVTPDTPFLLASVSKSITAMGVMQLVEDGKIKLDDPVKQYLPWFEVSGGEGGQITVADLLYQTSGLSEMGGIRATLLPDLPDALEAGVRSLDRANLEFQPGEGWEYSNLNYNVLGLLIQQVSGQRYEDYITEHIFAPLGMQHSYTSLQAAMAGGAASGYYPFFGIPLLYDNFMPYSRATLPSAGLWSSASDMSHYLIAHLNGGQYEGGSVLSAENITKLHQPGYMFDDVQGYAMGWTTNKGFMTPELLEPLDTELKNYGTLTVLFHEGDWADYKSMAFLIPELKYGAILLMNSNDHTVTSAFRYFAWDVTLIATGGDAQYFPPSEDFVVHYSRWIFAALVLLLAAGLVWATRAARKPRRAVPASASRAVMPSAALLLLVLTLNAYIHLKLLPNNNATLPVLIKNGPDLALLVLLIALLSLGIAAACIVLGWNALARRTTVSRPE